MIQAVDNYKSQLNLIFGKKLKPFLVESRLLSTIY